MVARWSVGVRTQGLSVGDRGFILRQRTNIGIVASGRLTDGMIFQAQHWATPGKTARYAHVTWDRVIPVSDRFPVEDLLVEIPSHD